MSVFLGKGPAMPMKVLVAEDEELQAKILEIALRKAGFDVETALTLFKAYEKTIDLTDEEADKLADLIIADLKFGKDTMAGLRFAWAIRGCPLTAHIPLIITTATADDSLRARLTVPGFPFHVVEKPYPPFRLIQLVSQLLEKTDTPEEAD